MSDNVYTNAPIARATFRTSPVDVGILEVKAVISTSSIPCQKGKGIVFGPHEMACSRTRYDIRQKAGFVSNYRARRIIYWFGNAGPVCYTVCGQFCPPRPRRQFTTSIPAIRNPVTSRRKYDCWMGGFVSHRSEFGILLNVIM